MTNNLNSSDESTILIVDDTETNIDILLEFLEDYIVAIATDGASAIEIANEEDIDLILLDILMPEMDGFEVCKILKQNEKTKNIPVIFITSNTDTESIETAYDVGGIDYITKPFRAKELLARVNRELKLAELIHNLSYMASYDSMTGIYNRRKFFELAQQQFATSNDLFVVMLDIDKFKQINDKHGHPVGDKVIKAVTKTITNIIDNDSTFGRLGGEEFAIVYSNKTEESVKQDIENIRSSIELLEIMDHNKIVKFTISSGISQKNAKTKDLDHLLKQADDFLYEAKEGGRNKVIFRL